MHIYAYSSLRYRNGASGLMNNHHCYWLSSLVYSLCRTVTMKARVYNHMPALAIREGGYMNARYQTIKINH